MAYALSFAPEFFYGIDVENAAYLPCTTRPTCVYQAVRSMSPEDWELMAREVFGVTPERLEVETVLAKILETNLCRNLDPPVEVHIDGNGDHTVLVYDMQEGGEPCL